MSYGDTFLSPDDRSKGMVRTPVSTRESPVDISPFGVKGAEPVSPTPRKRVYGQGRRLKRPSTILMKPFVSNGAVPGIPTPAASRDGVGLSPERYDPSMQTTPKRQYKSPYKSPTVSPRIRLDRTEEKDVWDFFEAETRLAQASPRKKLTDRMLLFADSNADLQTPKAETDSLVAISSRLQDSLCELEKAVVRKNEERVSTIPTFTEGFNPASRTYGMTRSFRTETNSDIDDDSDEGLDSPERRVQVQSAAKLKAATMASVFQDELEYLLDCFSPKNWGSLQLRRSSIVDLVVKVLQDKGFAAHISTHGVPAVLVSGVVESQEPDLIIKACCALMLTHVMSTNPDSVVVPSKPLLELIRSLLVQESCADKSWMPCLEIISREISVPANDICFAYFGLILLREAVHVLKLTPDSDFACAFLKIIPLHLDSSVDVILHTNMCSILEKWWSTGVLDEFSHKHRELVLSSLSSLVAPLEDSLQLHDDHMLRLHSHMCKLAIVLCPDHNRDDHDLALRRVSCNPRFVPGLLKYLEDCKILQGKELGKVSRDCAIFAIGLLYKIANSEPIEKPALDRLKSMYYVMTLDNHDAAYYFCLVIQVLQLDLDSSKMKTVLLHP